MSVQDLEAAVQQLSPNELDAFVKWFEEFIADEWDKKIEADALNGKLDHLMKRADEDFEAGRCTPL